MTGRTSDALRRLGDRIDQWSCLRAGVIIFLAAFAVRVGIMVVTASYLYPERDEIIRIAMSLAAHGTYADAYCDGCGPTAHAPPLYPLLLSVLFRVFGSGIAESIAQEVFSSLLASLQYALIPYVAAACGMRRAAGFLGGLLAALLPINRWVQTKGSFEYALSGLLFVIVTVAIIKTWRERDFSGGRGALIGLLWGLTLLTAPQFVSLMLALLVVPYLVPYLAPYLIPRPVRSRYWLFMAAQAAVAIICLAPWTIRNLVVLGSPIWSRSNLGLEMKLSNHEGVAALWDTNMSNGMFSQMHPFVNVAQAARVKAIGEVAYNKEALGVAREWISTHRARFIQLTAERAFYFWFPALHRGIQTIALAAITLSGFIGLFYYARRGGFAWQYFPLVWLIFPLSAYLFQQSGRMRYPIEWISFLFTAYWLVSMLQVTERQREIAR